jgi:hypothetical protein
MRDEILLSVALIALVIGVGVFAFTISLSDPSTAVLISSGCCALVGAASTFLAATNYQKNRNKNR